MICLNFQIQSKKSLTGQNHSDARMCFVNFDRFVFVHVLDV